MKRIVKSALNKIPYIRDMRQEITDLRQQVKKQGQFQAGHFYSPIPDKNEIAAFIEPDKVLDSGLLGIQMHKDEQFKLLNEYIKFYEDLPFPEQQQPDCRYYYENDYFSYSDAIFLYSFLRKYKPKRIVEIGSGFSSAVILETVDRFFSCQPEITFIEPNPERLKKLLRIGDNKKIKVLEEKVQKVPFDYFSSLESGDFLFIDSSHVVKFGSELNLLIFDVLPTLPPGVFVHFHYVFYPFEYPAAWLRDGMYWNEIYFLRAFLSYNYEWKITFFNDYVVSSFEDLIKEKMPLCIKNPGGSLYIQKGGDANDY